MNFPRFELNVRRHGVAFLLVVPALVLALALACTAAAPASAAEYRYKPVHVTNQHATFAVRSLSGRSLISARLVAPGARTRLVGVASVRRAVSRARPLQVSLPRSWRALRTASRRTMTLRVRTGRTATTPAAASVPSVSSTASGAAASGAATSIAPASEYAALAAGPLAPLGSPLWSADGESTMATEWASSSSVPVASAPPKPDPSRIAQSTFHTQGARSYRFEMRAGDDSYGARAELGQAAPERSGFENRLFRAGEDRWISLQYYLPTNWPTTNTWQTIMQIKPISGGGGGPSIGLDAGNSALKFYGNANTWGSTAGSFFDGAGTLPGKAYAMPRGRWIKFTFHVVFSADPAVGSLEVFGDLGDGSGMRTLVPRRLRATMKYLDGKMDPAQLRVGIYRDPTMTATASLYVDGITVATTRAAAEARAFAPAS
jgi:hypothetical protein